MTINPDAHVGDFGTTFTMVVTNRATNKPLNLSLMNEMYFLFEAPDEQTYKVNALIANSPGTDGRLVYIVEEGLFNVAGQWKAQAFVVNDTGQWHTDIETFEVGTNIAEPAP